MLSKGLQSQAYKLLLEQQAEDAERTAKLAELRKKQLRDEIRRKRDEEESREKRRREQLVRVEQQVQGDVAPAIEKKAQPLSVEEAKARRQRAEAVRNSEGLAKKRQPISSSYSSLLAAAPTKLEAVPRAGVKFPTSQSSDKSLQLNARTNDRSDRSKAQELGRPKPVNPTNSLEKSRSMDKSTSRLPTTRIASPEKARLPTTRISTPEKPRLPVTRRSSLEKPRLKSTRTSDDFIVEHKTSHESIWDILNPGKKRDRYLARDIDSDEDMEANADDIRREEQRAARTARLEDEREAKLLKEQEDRKAAKRRKAMKK